MKTRHFLKLQGTALAFALFGIAASATAQQAMGGSATQATFQSMDQNQDGHLTRSEIPADMSLLRTRFATYDANHDNMLDAREYAAAQAALHNGGHAGSTDEGAPQQHPADPTGG